MTVIYMDIGNYVNIPTAINIVLRDIDCEGFAVTHVVFFILLSHFTLYLPNLFYVPCRFYSQNSVTCLCISFNIIIPFLE